MIISANTDSSTSSPSKNLIYFVTGGIGLAIAVAGIIAYVFIMKKRNLKNKTALADIHSNRIEL
jgi:type IV secretory pathway VirB2 component (pilin)